MKQFDTISREEAKELAALFTRYMATKRKIIEKERTAKQKRRRFPAGAHLKGGRNAAVKNAELARRFYTPILPIVLELRREGLSLRGIARELDRRGIAMRLSYRQKPWNATQVARILKRAREQEL